MRATSDSACIIECSIVSSSFASFHFNLFGWGFSRVSCFSGAAVILDFDKVPTAGQAFADVKNVGNHKDREDCALARDQRQHGDDEQAEEPAGREREGF